MITQEDMRLLNDELGRFVHGHERLNADMLCAELGIPANAKQRMSMLTGRLIEASGLPALRSLMNSHELDVKTVRIGEDGMPEQPMSFPAFRYEDIASEEWHTSRFRRYLLDTALLFTVFRKNPDGFHLDCMFLWSMPAELVEEHARRAWERLHECVCSGRIVDYIGDDGKRHTSFPKSSENPCVHVRPHGSNTKDVYPLPVPDMLTGMHAFTKHSFWFNKSYVQETIERFKTE